MPTLTTDERQQSARRAAWALAATSLGFGVVQLDVSVVNVAITSMGSDLRVGVSALQWVVDAYTVALAALILSAGALGDRIGARRVFVAGFVLFTVASMACGLAPNLATLVGARAVQGVGAAILVPCSLTLLNHLYPEPRARARAVGIWAAGASVGLSGGPVVGGLLTSAFGWRAIFFINVPLGVVAIVLTLRHASETTRSTDRGVDVPGQVLAAITLVLLAASMVAGGRSGFGDRTVLAGLGAVVMAGALFVYTEARRADPMVPLGLFRSRTFAASTAVGLTINIAFYGLIFVLSLYFRNVHHYSPLMTGLAFAPATGIVFATNLLSGRAAERFGAACCVSAAAVVVAGALLAMLAVGADTPYVALMIQLMLLGAGLGLIVPVMTSALLGSVARDRSGVASGTLNTARQTGSVVGVAMFGSFAAAGVVHGLRLSLLVAAGLALLTALFALGMRGDSGRAEVGTPAR